MLIRYQRWSSLVNHTDKGAVVASLDLEFDLALGFRIESVIFAAAYIVSGVELGATLAHEDIARDDDFTTEFLHAQPFGFGIATIAGTARRFLMCHCTDPMP